LEMIRAKVKDLWRDCLVFRIVCRRLVTEDLMFLSMLDYLSMRRRCGRRVLGLDLLCLDLHGYNMVSP
jgi:hypothetical protein